MRVLQLGPYPPPRGGITSNMLAIRRELLAAGHHCSIVATSKSSLIVPEPDVYHPGGALALLKLLYTLKFDVLHIHVGGEISPRASGADLFMHGPRPRPVRDDAAFRRIPIIGGREKCAPEWDSRIYFPASRADSLRKPIDGRDVRALRCEAGKYSHDPSFLE